MGIIGDVYYYVDITSIKCKYISNMRTFNELFTLLTSTYIINVFSLYFRIIMFFNYVNKITSPSILIRKSVSHNILFKTVHVCN